MKLRRYFFPVLFTILSVISCSKDDSVETEESGETITTAEAIAIQSIVTAGTAEGNTADGADEDDLLANSSFPSVVKITFATGSATVDNSISGVTVTTNGADVTVNSTATGVLFELAGTTTDGTFKLYSEKKYELLLNNVNITNNDGPAINIQSGKRGFVVLAEGSTNTLTDGTTYTANATEDQKGTFFSEGQLIFSGTGSLQVAGNNKHGIVSDDYVRIIEGAITVTKAASDGIHTNDGIFVDGGTLVINADSDGLEAEEGGIIINDGSLTIKVADDGIVASYEEDDSSIDPFVTINGGDITIETTGTGGEGIESKSTLTINGGNIYVKAIDDAINAGTAIYINGGNIVAYSTTNDGIDSNGTLTITAGRVLAIGAKSPEAGFDCDQNTFKITGGLAIGLGGSTSTPTANASTQASAILAGANANTIYSILDSDNKEILTFQSPVSFSTLVVSSGQFVVGSSYKLVSVSSVNSASNFNGLYLGGSFVDPTVSKTFTLSSLVSNLGGSSGMGGGR
ncbi:carbohydrate-binding domain-containing protein [Sphingobacterium sp. LRF_L2]|uniref:carbohydrate-binding domain-containing protein n=1 Tax=Sphingobacterium sp. LRF_L2 TaxID=3369421 RepID=UPI003F609966